MTDLNRIDICKKMNANKRGIGLPLSVVRDVDSYLNLEWGIRPPLDPDVWDEGLLQIAGPDLFNRFQYLNDKQAKFKYQGKNIPTDLEQKFYNLISDSRISGFIHSAKRVHILDSAVFILNLIDKLSVSGRILDIGCNIGYHAILLGKKTGLEVLGIDINGCSIDVANKKSPNINQIKFETKSIESCRFDGVFDLVYSIDSIEITKNTISCISNSLKPNGVAVLIGGSLVGSQEEYKKNLLDADLGFGFADITGGWLGLGRSFEANSVLVLVKGGGAPLPYDLQFQTESGWEYFKEYANTPSVPWDEKTQSYFRGNWIDDNL